MQPVKKCNVKQMTQDEIFYDVTTRLVPNPDLTSTSNELDLEVSRGKVCDEGECGAKVGAVSIFIRPLATETHESS